MSSISIHRVITLCAAALLAGSTATAQPARVELGLFGDYASFAGALGLDDGFGGGARLGLFVLPRFEIEASGAVGTTSFSQPVTPFDVDAYMPVRARLIYNQPLSGGIALLLGGGYVSNIYVINGQWEGEDGWGGLLGVRLNLSRRFAFRIDGTADLLPALSDFEGGDVNYGLQSGFSLLIGGPDRRGGDPSDIFVPRTYEPSPSTEEPVAADEPDEPAPPDPAADEMLDSDGDGVLDSADRCPDSAADVDVDASGCERLVKVTTVIEPAAPAADRPAPRPEAPPAAASPPVEIGGAVREGVLAGVTFKSGWWGLEPGGEAALDGLAGALLANPSIRIEIIGHTDSSGTRRRNVWLSGYRAEAIKLYLTRKGIGADRIETAGAGPDQPIADNSTAAGRRQNRRVEIRILESSPR